MTRDEANAWVEEAWGKGEILPGWNLRPRQNKQTPEEYVNTDRIFKTEDNPETHWSTKTDNSWWPLIRFYKKKGYMPVSGVGGFSTEEKVLKIRFFRKRLVWDPCVDTYVKRRPSLLIIWHKVPACKFGYKIRIGIQ